MTTKFKLLIDEAVPDPLAKELMTLRSVKWQYVRDDQGLKGARDESLVKYATENKMVLVTVDGCMNEKAFAICTHSGIIVISVRRQHEAIRAGIFRKFLLSGYRKHARHAVTYLKHDKVVIRNEAGEQTFALRLRKKGR